jgi:hypothetical protein
MADPEKPDSMRANGQRTYGIRFPRRIGLLLCLAVFTAIQGCAINREMAAVTPDVELAHLKKFYVVKFDPDGRGINTLIMAELGRMGFDAATGLEAAAPKTVDAIVTYRDKWQWDITMYMIELRIFIREPATQILLATGTSYHTSLTRKSPEEMVAEVLANIFAKARKAP